MEIAISILLGAFISLSAVICYVFVSKEFSNSKGKDKDGKK